MVNPIQKVIYILEVIHDLSAFYMFCSLKVYFDYYSKNNYLHTSSSEELHLIFINICIGFY